MTVARPAEDLAQAFGEGQPQPFTVDLFTDMRLKTRDTTVPTTANVRAVFKVPSSATTFGYACALSSASLARWGWRIGGASPGPPASMMCRYTSARRSSVGSRRRRWRTCKSENPVTLCPFRRL